MGLFVYRFKLVNGVVRIYLRGRQIGMPQDLLDRVQVGAIIKHVRGKSVPDYVWASLADRGHLVKVMMYSTINHLRIKLFTFVRQKEMR
jgi:hypothetical protein